MMPESETNEPDTNPTATAPAKAGDATSTEPPTNGAAPEQALAAQIEAAKAEAAANYDKFMRAAADLDNFRRRALREKEELRTAATALVLEDIFPVLDTLSFAIDAAKQPNSDVKSLIGGIDMVLF